jgi:hypothetical protein
MIYALEYDSRNKDFDCQLITEALENPKVKVGRNDPCPCGSGKKYKKCCLGKNVVSSETLNYRRLSEAHDRLVDRLASYAARIFGEEAVHVAMHEFLLWPDPEDEIDKEMLDRLGPLFWPWYLFNWEYDPIEGDVELAGPKDRTVAELYAEERGARLDPVEKKLIDGINREPYSFWEVLDVEALYQWDTEIREQLAEMFMNHWESWVDQKIPALGGKSPQKAIKTPDGCEAVEALLQEAEQDRWQEPLMLEVNRRGAQRVREILGLKRPFGSKL